MEDSTRFEYFLNNFMSTKKDEWFELLFYEYYRNITKLKKFILKHKEFSELGSDLYYHMFKIMNSEMKPYTNNDDVIICLRKFFTTGIGARIMVFLDELDILCTSTDMIVTHSIRFAFPTEVWEEDMSIARLPKVSRNDLLDMYKVVKLKNPNEKVNRTQKYKFTAQLEDAQNLGPETFETAEFKKFIDQFYISPAEFAVKFINIYQKLTHVESYTFVHIECVKDQLDLSCPTYYSMMLALDNLTSLNKKFIFNESDQTVIKKKLMLLLFVSIKNLLNCYEKNIELIHKKILIILETENDIEITCGLILCLLNLLRETKSEKDAKIFNYKFSSIGHQMVLNEMQRISSDKQLFHYLQRHLIIIIKSMKKSSNEQKIASQSHHHNSYNPLEVTHCIFERLLIKSVVYIKSYKQLLIVLKYLLKNGICCCNADIETMKVFLRSTTIPSVFLKFMEKRVVKVLFKGARNYKCTTCSGKMTSNWFRRMYLDLVRTELNRRNGYELYNLYNHLIIIEKFMPKYFLKELIINIIIPKFIEAKRMYFSDTDNTQYFMDICCFCLQLMNENAKFVVDALTEDVIQDLADCTLVPVMSIYSCMILRHGLENLVDKTVLLLKIKSVLFTNTHSLISELLDIYNEIGLSKISFETEPKASTSDTSGFEIVDEHNLLIKENLSKLDVLFLSSVHFNILCDRICKSRSFKADFLANIRNNFNEDILFSIAYHAINTILLKKDIAIKPIIAATTTTERNCQNDGKCNQLEVNTRCDYLKSIIMNEYDINYDLIISRSYKLFEICQNFSDKLQSESCEENPFCMTYSIARDKNIMFIVPSVHRDNFLSENALEDAQKNVKSVLDIKDDKDNDENSYQHYFHQLLAGIGEYERKNIRDALTKFVYRFIRPEDGLEEIHRLNAIKEITNNIGSKYLQSIAKSCFEICFRLWRNQKLSTRMSTAIQELKLLLLQDEWIESKDSLFEVLELLIKVAEMKVKNVNQILMTNAEPMPQMDLNFFDNLDVSSIKVTFSESDDEKIEEDNKTETYYSADENYDADEEYYSTVGEEPENPSFSFNTISNFKKSSKSICKLVIEILMNLSMKYLENKSQWDPEILTSLMKRLSSMNKFFGDSDFIIKGFSPILSRNEHDLETLQKSILELIGDLNSPEILKACFSLLTQNNVPIELIIARMTTLCNQETFPKPFSAVQYPICQDKSEITITSTCDEDITALINSYRKIHIANDVWTPFIEAAQIIPLNIFERKLWHSSGYTLSTWIELEEYQNTDCTTSIHLLSFGTDKLVLAVNINSNGFFEFNVIKPNQNYGHKKANKNKLFRDNSTDMSNNPDHQSNKENNKNNRNIKGIAAVLEDDHERNIRTRGSIKSGFKKSMSREDNFNRRMETTKVSRKSTKCKIPFSHWTHVCLSIRNTDSTITILITLNGIEHESIEIPVNDMLNSDVNGKLQLLFIGSQKDLNEDDFHSSIKYSMSNVLLFKVPIETTLIACLFGLGPDCDNFFTCELMQLMPLRGFIDLSKLISRTSLSPSHYDLMSKLQSNVILTHNFIKASYATIYMKENYGIRSGICNIGKIVRASEVNSLARSIYFSGGLSSMLFLFARTVELTNDPETQSSALYILLKNAYTNNYLNAEFEQRNLFNLITHVFKHGNVYRGPGMLKAILDVIYGGSMFYKKSKNEEYAINEKSELNIQNGSLLIKLLTHFNIFQTFNSTETKNLNIFFKSIINTVRESHPCKAANIQCLRDHGFFEKLMQFCKTHLTSTPSSMRINAITAVMLIDLIKMMIKQPPSMWSIKEIQNLLLLLHRPSESFLTHDRSKFNFILPSHKPPKQNRINTTILPRYFSFSTKIRSANASITSPTSSEASNSKNITEPQPSTSKQSNNHDLAHSDTDLLKYVRKGSIKKRFKKTKKFDEFEDQMQHQIGKALKTTPKFKAKSESPPIIKINRKRLQSKPKRKRCLQRTSTTIHLQIGSEYVINPEIVEKFKSSLTLSSSNASDIEVVQDYEGIYLLQELLLILLTDIIKDIDDLRLQTEFPQYLEFQCFIMFANHQDPDVRASLINFISTLVSRQSTEIVNSYENSNYWIHLANQLAIWPVNMNMVQACLDWICNGNLKIDKIDEKTIIDIDFKEAFRVLICMLPSMTHDMELLKRTIIFINFVSESSDENFHYLMDQGLHVALIKSLINIGDFGYFNCISLTLETIAVRSFKTMKFIQTLWDVLYGLVYAERQNKSIREVHLNILKILLNMCLIRQERRGSRTGDVRYIYGITNECGNLPESEIKLRFNLVLERTIQYIFSWDIDAMKFFEIHFFHYLIDLCFSGIQCKSFLLWSLSQRVCVEIKLFTAHKLLANLAADPNFSVPDPKLFKALLFQFINNNQELFTEDQMNIFKRYCGQSITQQQQNWNINVSTTQRIDLLHRDANKDQSKDVDVKIFQLEPLVSKCIHEAMNYTKDIMKIQNKERRNLLNQLKKTQEIDFYHEWYELIQRMTHEDAPWYNQELYPTTFELDEIEGPGRIRIRLKRTVFKIAERFFNDEFKFKAEYQQKKQLLDYLLNLKETERYSIRDRIICTHNVKYLAMEQEIDGEIIITDTQFIFLTNQNNHNNSIISNIGDIREIWSRRYQHKELALEFFLKSNKSFFIIFGSKSDRDDVNRNLSTKIGWMENSMRVEKLTQLWTDNKLTNFEYLMELNKLSGRSYNDITQYPVFPWILTSFEGDVLDLTNVETFRNLSRTISTQIEGLEKQYGDYYESLKQPPDSQPSHMKPYHYSSLYSNSGTVLHFLVRLPPFTSMFLNYQDNNFDLPDRTFHNLSTTFKLTSRESFTDVKELTPEFYYLPDFLENQEGFNYGKRQNGEQVNDVKLPEWCGESARNFILIHRQAFESEFVRRNLNNWIDLIFGYKQKGDAAQKALNVFHFATYPEFQAASVSDPIMRLACETMVKTYGQVPKQLFTSPHRKSSIINEKAVESRGVLRNIKGLKWGIYTGSPQLPKPKMIKLKKQTLCKQKNMRLILVEKFNTFLVVPEKCSLIQGTSPESIELILWKERDRIVRKKSLDSKRKTDHLFSLPTCDPVTTCLTHINHPHIWFGHLSGKISVYVRITEPGELKREMASRSTMNEALEEILDISVGTSSSAMNFISEFDIDSKWLYPITLMKHKGEILSIKMCPEFKIAVSFGIDGCAVIWDTQKIEYIRTIEPSCNTLRSQLSHVDISPTLGDILTVFNPKDLNEDADINSLEMSENNGDDFINVSMSMAGKSQLRLNNINGKYIKHIFQDGLVTATCFSFIKEGTGVNVIVAAFNDFTIRMFSTWNLDVVREIDTGLKSLIRGISFSTHHFLGVITDQEVYLWGTDGLNNEQPGFHDIILVG